METPESSSFPFPSSSRARVFPNPSDTQPLPPFYSLPNPNPLHRSVSDVCVSDPMDYGYRAAEDRDPFLFSSLSSASVNGYFTEKALRAGYIDAVGDIRRGDLIYPIPSREALQQELQKEPIRKELIARDIAQRRILEEELRRNLELERAMATRLLQMERYSWVAGAWVHPEAGSERGMQFDPEARMGDRFGPPRVPPYPEDMVHEWSSPPSPVPFKPVVGRKLPLPQHQPEVSPFREIIPSKPKLSGMKRRAVAGTGGELPRPSQKEWSCALCQVSAISKQGLDEHLQGKRHRANQEALIEGKKRKATEAPSGANKIERAKKAVGSTSLIKVNGKSLPAGGASTGGACEEPKRRQAAADSSEEELRLRPLQGEMQQRDHVGLSPPWEETYGPSRVVEVGWQTHDASRCWKEG